MSAATTPQTPAQPSADQVIRQILALLQRIPPDQRASFAKTQLSGQAPQIVKMFENIPPSSCRKTVLYLALQPHSREARLAAAAKKAGWYPVLVYLAKPNYQPSADFAAHAAASGVIEMVLASWLFPGPLAHLFTLAGEDAHLFAMLKPRRLVLDFYDTSSGMRFKNTAQHAAERDAASAADGFTHRDLRMHFLQKCGKFPRFKHNVFICDPFASGDQAMPRRMRSPDNPIRIVSTGWAGNPPDMIVRIVRKLACENIHVHLHLNSFEVRAAHTVAMYRRLEAENPAFHLEPTLSGEAYWDALAGYDFGLSLTDAVMFDEEGRHYTHDYIAGCGSSRLSDYIRAGLGVICSPKFRFQNYWARRYAMAVIPATQAWLGNPLPVLRETLQKMQSLPPRNLYSATVDAVASRLGRFYDAVAES